MNTFKKAQHQWQRTALKNRPILALGCIFSFIFVVLAWYDKYINKGMGLEELQWFFLFPLVVSLSVVCFWLCWLL